MTWISYRKVFQVNCYDAWFSFLRKSISKIGKVNLSVLFSWTLRCTGDAWTLRCILGEMTYLIFRKIRSISFALLPMKENVPEILSPLFLSWCPLSLSSSPSLYVSLPPHIYVSLSISIFSLYLPHYHSFTLSLSFFPSPSLPVSLFPSPTIAPILNSLFLYLWTLLMTVLNHKSLFFTKYLSLPACLSLSSSPLFISLPLSPSPSPLFIRSRFYIPGCSLLRID